MKEEELSEEYSVTSSTSEFSEKELKCNCLANNDNDNNKIEEYNNSTYRDFVRIYLKIKFEKLYKNNKGSTMDKNVIWKEISNKKIPQKHWTSFILEELKKPYKFDSTNSSKFTKM